MGDVKVMCDALCLSSNMTALTGGDEGMHYYNGDAFRFGTGVATPLSGCLWVNFRV